VKKTTERALWIGGSALAAAGLVTVGVLATRSSSAAPSPAPVPPAPGPSGSTTLTQGHSYKLSVKCPTPLATPILTGVAVANVTVKATTPKVLSGGTASALGWDLTFDYTGATTTSAPSPESMLGTPSGCTVTLTDMGATPIGGVNPSTLPPGPYTSLMSNTMQAYGTYLLEIPPQQPGESYTDFATHLANIAPYKLTVSQSFDLGTLPPGWPSKTPNVWRYVVNYAGSPPANPTGLKAPPPWTLPASFASVAMWATGGNTQ